jgi:hypothetical protein
MIDCPVVGDATVPCHTPGVVFAEPGVPTAVLLSLAVGLESLPPPPLHAAIVSVVREMKSFVEFFMEDPPARKRGK